MKRLTPYALAVTLVALLSAFAPVSAAMVADMNPMVAGVTITSVFVLVECTTNATVTVQFGTSPGSYTRTATTTTCETSTASTYMHNVKLINLTPNTRYYYRAYQVAGTYSAESSFWTACEPGTSYRFAYMADNRDFGTRWNTLADVLAGYDPRMILCGGDTAEPGTYAAWKSEFFPANAKALFAKCPYTNATGNHEDWNATNSFFTEAPNDSSGEQDYFSFDYGDVHFVVMDTADNSVVPWYKGSVQADWVAADLAASDKTWKIVSTHVPAYSGGGSHGENPNMITLTNDIFKPNGVDFVLAGHDHIYQVNYVNGIHHLVMGSAGQLAGVLNTKPYSEFGSIEDNIGGIFDVTSSSIHFMGVYQGGQCCLRKNRHKRNSALVHSDANADAHSHPCQHTHTDADSDARWIQPCPEQDGDLLEATGGQRSFPCG